MANRPPERYAPGELGRTRKNLGEITLEEAREMSRVLAGEIGTERSQDDIDKKYRELADLNRRRSDKFVRTSSTSMVFERKERSDSQNRVPVADIKTEPGYFQRIKMNFLAARPEHQLMRYSRAVLSILSFVLPVRDLVNPAFVKRGDTVFFDHVGELVSSVKSLAAKAKGNPLTKKIHPFYFKVIDEICSWDVEGIHEELTLMQKSPRSITFDQCRTLCAAFYKPIITLMDLDEDFYVGGALKKLHDAVLMTIPKNHPDVDNVKRFYRTARTKMTLVFREIKFRLYPLLLKNAAIDALDFDEFLVEYRDEIIDTLSITPEQVLHAPVIDESEAWIDTIDNDADAENETESEGEAPEKAAPAAGTLLEKDVQVGLEVLRKLFPGAGFGVLSDNPDLYKFFQPLLDFPRGVELLSPADPLHQVVVIVAILQELFYGFKSITFGTLRDSEGTVQGISDRIDMRLIAWRAVLDETILDSYVMELYEYCRQYEKEHLFGSTRIGKQLAAELEWKKKLLILPHLRVQRPYGFTDETMAHLPRLQREVDQLDMFLAVISRNLATGTPTDAVLNPKSPAEFEVPNPVSRRLARVLQREGKRLTNDQLFLHTSAILSLLKSLISDPESHLYRSECPLFRTERGSDGKPMFTVPTVNPHEIMQRYDAENHDDEVQSDSQGRDPVSGFFLPELLKRYLHTTATLCDSREEAFCLVGLGIQGLSHIEKAGNDAKELERILVGHIKRNIRGFSDIPFRISPGNYIILLPDTKADEALIPLKRVFGKLNTATEAEPRIPLCAALVQFQRGISTDHHLRRLKSALKEVFKLPAPSLIVLDPISNSTKPVSVG